MSIIITPGEGTAFVDLPLIFGVHILGCSFARLAGGCSMLYLVGGMLMVVESFENWQINSEAGIHY